eukprot:CAMPEP_0119376386 /NCGR_PEP_ID=MMETSP1334-20130426/40045_1 /TAXON_ID=127549 /ORGANISM="Calcidiscus leptoporus, Strain RCC1130" /LENGTH=106 /DNA_ID=CAMNT_0007394941 /DNA_START=472 /DNA_END=792 /DNA_ORIENTATION=-
MQSPWQGRASRLSGRKLYVPATRWVQGSITPLSISWSFRDLFCRSGRKASWVCDNVKRKAATSNILFQAEHHVTRLGKASTPVFTVWDLSPAVTSGCEKFNASAKA